MYLQKHEKLVVFYSNYKAFSYIFYYLYMQANSWRVSATIGWLGPNDYSFSSSAF